MKLTLTYDMQGGMPQLEPYSEEVMDGAPALCPLPMTGFAKEGFTFQGWTVNGTDYPAEGGDTTVSILEDSTVVAKWAAERKITTVSPKAYGFSPNGTKNALGTTRYHHQPGYPRPMGV